LTMYSTRKSLNITPPTFRPKFARSKKKLAHFRDQW
jgi:hypothetical protein